MRDEYRLGLTPDKVDVFPRAGHHVRVEADAGEGAGFGDAAFEEAGATLVGSAAEVYEADIVAKVKRAR